jgi:SAM-dependent methyltransferase
MSLSVPEIFDHRQRNIAKRRANQMDGDYDFLFVRVAEELAQRALGISRKFQHAWVHGPKSARDIICRELSENCEIIEQSDEPGRRTNSQGDATIQIKDPSHWQFKPESLDLIIIAWDLHAVEDLPGSLAQIKLALKPDGLLLAGFPGGDTLTELRQSFMQAETEIRGGISPRIHPFATLQDMAGLMQRAGFALPVVDQDKLEVRYANPLRLADDLRGMGETNALISRSRNPLRRDVLFHMIETYQNKFVGADGKVPACFEILYLTGWAPHESQQKPLRPGSAKMSLAEALNTKEISLKDK